MAQIAAEVLNIATESVKVVHGNTDVAPYDMGTLGSRSTFHMGNAVRRAAEDARDKLAALAAEAGLPAGTNYDVREVFRKRYGMQAGNVIGTGTFVPHYTPPDPATGQSPDVTPFWMVGGTGAEVEVDTETGHVRVTQAGQCRGRRKTGEPQNLQDPNLGRRDHAAGLHPPRGHDVRWRPGHERILRRLQNSRVSATCRVMEAELVNSIAGNRPVRRQGRG